ncbi:MAG: Hsp20/alpha crystallin family protein [Pseudomonadales bacterium]|nr:Hsp20/alpha crystallin family protein [Pseudomonadales bacterium]
MNTVRWNPIREFDGLFGRNSELASFPNTERTNHWYPPVDIHETENGYNIDMEVPAVDPKDIDVSVKDGVLTVSGERKSEVVGDDEKRGKSHRVERYYGAFARSFRLPEDADETQIKAKVDKGVLYLELNKQKEVAPRNIKIEVN